MKEAIFTPLLLLCLIIGLQKFLLQKLMIKKSDGCSLRNKVFI